MTLGLEVQGGGSGSDGGGIGEPGGGCARPVRDQLLGEPTWGSIRAHSAGRALQRSQPAPQVTQALSEACLLGLQQLLQLAGGREDLLPADTVLEGETSHMLILGVQKPPRSLIPAGPPACGL